jgi:hypothetical protein
MARERPLACRRCSPDRTASTPIPIGKAGTNRGRVRSQWVHSVSEYLPSITVVTPCLNDGHYLAAAIESVLAQDYPELEYIVVDGGSTDGCVDIIRKSEGGLASWVSERDGGQYEAINKGFAKSTGTIMAWLNSDDMYCPWALRTVATIFTTCPEVEWLTTTTKLNWTVDGAAADPTFSPGYSRRWFFSGDHIGLGHHFRGAIQQESTFWRRSLWERAGGHVDERYKLAGDFELWSRFWNETALYATTVPLGGFRCRPGQRSGDFAAYADEARRALEVAPRRALASRSRIGGAGGLGSLHRLSGKVAAGLHDSSGHFVRYDLAEGTWRTSKRLLFWGATP